MASSSPAGKEEKRLMQSVVQGGGGGGVGGGLGWGTRQLFPKLCGQGAGLFCMSPEES